MQNNTYSGCDLISPFGLAESDLHFIAMPTSSRKIVINKGYVGDDSATNESLGLKQISLKEANFGAASDPGSALYETHEEKPHPARRSNGRYLPLFFFACLLSIVAIILSLLTLWGNFGEKCDCSKTEG